MSLTTPPTEPAPSDVKLRCARIVVWNDGQRTQLDAADLPSEYVARAAAAAEPIWVQLLLPWLSEDQQAWFEGSVDPWQELEEPELDWTEVRSVLDAVGIGSSALDPYERRLLERLPYLYGRGVARVAREVWGARSNAPAHLRFFPTVAFRPMIKRLSLGETFSTFCRAQVRPLPSATFARSESPRSNSVTGARQTASLH